MHRIPHRANGLRLLFRDPALAASVLILWILLGLFVLFPLGWLLARTFTEGGTFTLGNLLGILKDPNHRQSFWNSLLLAAPLLLGAGALLLCAVGLALLGPLRLAWAQQGR